MRKFFSILLVFVLFGCEGGSSAERKPRLSITSSTQLLPLAEVLANAFQEETGHRVSVKGTLGKEEELLRKGLTDIVITTESSSSEGISSRCFAIDKTVLIVNARNPLTQISQEQLASIFTGKRLNWADLGGTRAEIQVLARESGSSTRESFERNFLAQTNLSEISLRALLVNSNIEMTSAVSKIAGGIGYVSLGSLKPGVKILAVYDGSGMEIKSSEVKIFAQSLSNGEKEEIVQFQTFIEGKKAGVLIADEGFLALDPHKETLKN